MTSYKQTNAGGVNGATVTVGSGGTADGSTAYGSVAIAAGGTDQFDNTHTLYGGSDLAVEIATAATAAATYVGFGANATYATRSAISACFYLTAFPPSSFRALNLPGNGSVSISATGGLQVFDNAGGGGGLSFANSIPLNQMFRLELGVKANSTTVGQLELRLFTDPFGSTPTESHASAANLNTSASAPTDARAGITAAAPANCGPLWVEYLQYNNAALTYPPPPPRLLTLSTSVSAAAAMSRQVGLPRQVIQASTPIVIRQPRLIRSASQPLSPSIAKQAQRILAASQATSAAAVRRVGLPRSAAVGTSATVTLTRLKIVALTAVQGTAATISRQIRLARAVAQPSTAKVIRSITLVRSASQPTTGTAARRLTKTLTATVTAVPAVVRKSKLTRLASQATAAAITLFRTSFGPTPLLPEGVGVAIAARPGPTTALLRFNGTTAATVTSTGTSQATPAAPGSTSAVLNTMPPAPVLTSATPGNTTVALAWRPSPGGATYQPQVNGVDYGAPLVALAATVTGLTNGVASNFTVTANNPTGTSAPSNTLSATPTGASLPTMPATWSDTVADIPGANWHLPFTGYAYSVTPDAGSGYTTSADAVRGSMDYAKIRHGRDNISINSTTQRAALATICSGGIDVLFSCGDLTSGSESTLQGQIPSIVSDVLTHYSGITVALEGLNESNGTNPTTKAPKDANWAADTRTYQQALWNAAHPHGITVYSPPLADPASAAATLGSVDAWSDWNSMHAYAGGKVPSANLDSKISASVANVSGSKPMTFSECGYNTAIHAASGNSPVTEAVQALYTPILMLEMLLRGVKRAYIYELVDDKREDTLTNIERHFGLFAWDAQTAPSWRAKPAATALRNLQTLTADPGTTYSPAGLPLSVGYGGTDLHQALLGKQDGSYLLCLWRNTPVWQQSSTANAGHTLTVTPATATVTLGSAKTLTRYDFQSDGTAPSTALGSLTSTAVSLAGALSVLTIV